MPRPSLRGDGDMEEEEETESVQTTEWADGTEPGEEADGSTKLGTELGTELEGSLFCKFFVVSTLASHAASSGIETPAKRPLTAMPPVQRSVVA